MLMKEQVKKLNPTNKIFAGFFIALIFLVGMVIGTLTQANVDLTNSNVVVGNVNPSLNFTFIDIGMTAPVGDSGGTIPLVDDIDNDGQNEVVYWNSTHLIVLSSTLVEQGSVEVGQIFGHPTSFDIDLDGFKELNFISESSGVFSFVSWEYDGSSFTQEMNITTNESKGSSVKCVSADKRRCTYIDNNNSVHNVDMEAKTETSFSFFSAPNIYFQAYTVPAIKDWDDDNSTEVFFTTSSGTDCFLVGYELDTDSEEFSPILLDSLGSEGSLCGDFKQLISPVLVDIDGDGKEEIIVGTGSESDIDQVTKIYALYQNGTLIWDFNSTRVTGGDFAETRVSIGIGKFNNSEVLLIGSVRNEGAPAVGHWRMQFLNLADASILALAITGAGETTGGGTRNFGGRSTDGFNCFNSFFIDYDEDGTTDFANCHNLYRVNFTTSPDNQSLVPIFNQSLFTESAIGLNANASFYFNNLPVDLNNDGFIDFLFTNTTQTAVLLELGQSNATEDFLCQCSGSCKFRECFNYTDDINNHGWVGDSLNADGFTLNVSESNGVFIVNSFIGIVSAGFVQVSFDMTPLDVSSQVALVTIDGRNLGDTLTALVFNGVDVLVNVNLSGTLIPTVINSHPIGETHNYRVDINFNTKQYEVFRDGVSNLSINVFTSIAETELGSVSVAGNHFNMDDVIVNITTNTLPELIQIDRCACTPIQVGQVENFDVSWQDADGDLGSVGVDCFGNGTVVWNSFAPQFFSNHDLCNYTTLGTFDVTIYITDDKQGNGSVSGLDSFTFSQQVFPAGGNLNDYPTCQAFREFPDTCLINIDAQGGLGAGITTTTTNVGKPSGCSDTYGVTVCALSERYSQEVLDACLCGITKSIPTENYEPKFFDWKNTGCENGTGTFRGLCPLGVWISAGATDGFNWLFGAFGLFLILVLVILAFVYVKKHAS